MNQELFKLAPFVTVILKKENQLLLVKRKENARYFPGFFCCPGGKVDQDETIFQAAARELQEELGITIDATSSRVVHVCHFKRNGDFEGLDFYVMAEKWNGEPRIMEPEKHDSVVWFALDALPDNMMSNHKLALEHIKKGLFYSEQGWK